MRFQLLLDVTGGCNNSVDMKLLAKRWRLMKPLFKSMLDGSILLDVCLSGC